MRPRMSPAREGSVSKGSSAPTKSPGTASGKVAKSGAGKAPTATGKAKRKTETGAAPAAAAPAPAAVAPAPAAAPGVPGAPGTTQPLVRPELTAIALETSARVKRQRVLDIIIPQSTSARMAEAARAS